MSTYNGSLPVHVPILPIITTESLFTGGMVASVEIAPCERSDCRSPHTWCDDDTERHYSEFAELVISKPGLQQIGNTWLNIGATEG